MFTLCTAMLALFNQAFLVFTCVVLSVVCIFPQKSETLNRDAC